MLSDNLLIEESDQLRRMDVGEVMEVFQGAPGRTGEENCSGQLGDESFLDEGVRSSKRYR